MRINHLSRREFITLLGGAATWSLVARAQQPAKLPTIGFLGADASAFSPWTAAFVARMRELGWIEGRTISIEYRWSEGRPERYTEIAAEFVRLKVDVIVTVGSAVPTVKQATSVIPIVFALATDPVGSGLVASLAHPGGNITGFHNYEPALGAKWMGILKEIAPAVRRAAFVHVPEITANVAFMRVGEASSAALGMTVSGAGVRNAADIEHVVTEFAKEANGGLIVTPSPLTATRRAEIIELAARLRLPAIYSFRFYTADGGLISYGIDQNELVREAASYVDRILRGTNPAELPVQLPTKYQLVINMKTANALGLNVPNSMQLLADEVIE